MLGAPDTLTAAVRAADGRPENWTIDWVSPREADDWAEYRDDGFLSILGQQRLAEDLSHFWPKNGPQWDALGRSSSGGAVLVEAKAHIGELASTCAAGEASASLIRASLDHAKGRYGAPADSDWLTGYYQYANRLAHLAFLHDHGVDATLAFVYFCGDHERGGPADAAGWHDALGKLHSHLQLSGDLASQGIVSVYFPVDGLA